MSDMSYNEEKVEFGRKVLLCISKYYSETYYSDTYREEVIKVTKTAAMIAVDTTRILTQSTSNAGLHKSAVLKETSLLIWLVA
jgi:hypothetical protein